MPEAKTRIRTTPVTPLQDPASDTRKKAKAMLEQATAKITENVSQHGYKEDKVALTLLNGAIEVL